MNSLFRILVLVCSSLLCSQARATSSEDVAGFIRAAQQEIMIAAPVLRVRVVANELHVAMKERHVRVRIISGFKSVRDAGSYWWTLQQDGAEIRTVEVVKGFALIVDRRVGITGDLIGRILEPDEVNLARIERGASLLGLINQWERVWSQAHVFSKPLEAK
jgi:hypothetical protein